MNSSARTYLTLLVALSLLTSGYGFYLGTIGEATSLEFDTVWGVVFALVTALWILARSKEKGQGFDWPAYVFLAWVLVVPFQLWRTNGIEGLLLYFGLLFLWFLYGVVNLYGYWYFFE